MNPIEDLNTMSNMDGQMMPKWTQMKTWIPWAIWMDKWCQNKLKWRLESHEQYRWSNDAKMNSNEDLNPMSNMDGQMMPKWSQMKSSISWALWMDKWCQNDTQLKTWIPWAIWMDKWCQNELKWRLESHEQYGWTNDAKINSNEDLNPMSNMDGQMMPKWTQMKTSNIMSNMDGQMMPKWTQMKTWIPWEIWMFKWCQNELKWRLEPHEQYGWTNDAKMNSNELKWRLESHEQYGWTNDAKINSNEDLNPMSNMDGQMMPKWTQMKTQISWAIWMDKWCRTELKWRLESHEQYGCSNDAKMNSNEDLNPMSNTDGQMMPKWTQMKTWIPWAIWMDKWCQNKLKW